MKLTTSQRLAVGMATLKLRGFIDAVRRKNAPDAMSALSIAIAELTHVRDELFPDKK